jgi:hypothetical protein
VAWFLRAVEQADGKRVCSHGRVVFDRRDEQSDALDHRRDVTATVSRVGLFVHRRGVTSVGTVR